MYKVSKNIDQIPLLAQITEDIYKLSVRFPFGMREMNSYLVRGENGFTVIDTGSKSKESIELWKRVTTSGFPIEKVVLTHAHPDHIGLSKWFQKQYGVPVIISSLGYKEILENRSSNYSDWINYLIKRHGGPELAETSREMEPYAFHFDPDEVFEMGQRIKLGNDMFETIWTPGHSPDHVCFYHRDQQLMLIGDHVLKDISPVIGVFSEGVVNPLQDYLESLEKIRTFSIDLALPGHGDIIINPEKRVEEMISRHQYQLQRTLEMVQNEGKTAGQICLEMYGELNIRKILAPLMSSITRLIYLESIEKVRSEEKGGKLYYKST